MGQPLDEHDTTFGSDSGESIGTHGRRNRRRKGGHMGHRYGHFAAHSRGHGRGGGGRHRAKRGAVVNAIATLLEERPMHGYELITEMGERSNGRWQPSAGTIYPALHRMEDRGLIEGNDVDGKRQFTLTDTGRVRLAEMREAAGDDESAPWDEPGAGRRGDLRGTVAELVGQVRQIGRFGTPEQAEQASAVLDDAKRKLYAILATEPPSDEA